MAVKIRLQRKGRKQMPYYYIVVADARSPRDGKFIERLGSYNPNTNPATIELNNERALEWLDNGAQPTETARAILSNKGVMFRKHLQRGIAKGAITADKADEKFAEWLEDKAKKIDEKIIGMKDKVSADMKSRLEAEAAVNHKRAEEIIARRKAAEDELVAAAKAANADADEAEGGSEAPTEEVSPADETKATPAAE